MKKRKLPYNYTVIRLFRLTESVRKGYQALDAGPSSHSARFHTPILTVDSIRRLQYLRRFKYFVWVPPNLWLGTKQYINNKSSNY